MKSSVKEELRKLTYENRNNNTPVITLSDIKVELIDWCVHPYKAMFNMGLMTWGNKVDKWQDATPECRLEVVKQILRRKALPLALDAPVFTFLISNVSRACFDQIARARIGVVFASKGQKDDYLNDLGFCLNSKLNQENNMIAYNLAEEVNELVIKSKDLYLKLQREFPNWACRCVLPMYLSHNFAMSITYSSLSNLCSKRMETTEMEDTVLVAWLLREEVKKVFPLLAEYLRPRCDFIKRDTTNENNGFSEAVGVPHSSDNRHPGFQNNLVEFEEACTSMKVLEEATKLKFPGPNDWIEYEWDNLSKIDKEHFQKV